MAYDDPTDPAGGTDPTQRLDATDSIDSGDPPRRPSGRARRGVSALLAAVALLVAGAVGAALAGGNGSEGLAVSAGSTASPSADEDESERPGRLKRFEDGAERHRGGALRGGGPGFALGFGHGPMGGALHGTFVVPDPDGGYRTVVTQRGEVTAVSDTSLTVKSEDGFTTSYRLTDDTMFLGDTDGVDAIEDGDQVSVSGVRSDGTTTALHVADLSRFEDLRREAPGMTPDQTPDPSSTTEGTSAAA